MTSAIWTPRHGNAYVKTKWGHVIYLGQKKHSFSPNISHEPYVAPPPPPPLKRPQPQKEANKTAQELYDAAARLKSEAEELEASVKSLNTTGPPVDIQLGLILCQDASRCKSLPKEWDTKGRGEVAKGEFRLAMRTLVTAGSAECDALFESWDADGGGSLDHKELTQALMGCMKKADLWKQEQASNPQLARAKALRHQAMTTEQAATSAEEAEQLEEEYANKMDELERRADIRLGYLLSMRKVKPGLVVTLWAKSRGEHQGELSKKEFREKCQELGLHETGPNATTGAEIDAIFDEYDADGGGYMDAEEAKEMVRGLQKTAEEEEQKRNRMERAARKARVHSQKKVAQAEREHEEMKEALAKMEEDLASKSASESKGAEASQTGKQDPAKKKKRQPIAAKSDRPAAIQGIGSLLDGVGALKAGYQMLSNRLFSDRGREDKERQQKVDMVYKQAAARIMHIEVALAINSWKSYLSESQHMHYLMDNAMRNFQHPMMRKGFFTWQENAEERKRALGLVLQSLRFMALQNQITCFRQWLQKARIARHVRRATHAVISGRAHSKLSAMFGAWHADMMKTEMERRLKEQGACAALGYWLRAKLSRCGGS